MDDEWIELLAQGAFITVFGPSVQGAAVYTIVFDDGPPLLNVDELLRCILSIYELLAN